MFKIIKADPEDVIVAHYRVPDAIVGSWRVTQDWVVLPSLDASIKHQDVSHRLLYTTLPRVLGLTKRSLYLSAFAIGTHDGTTFVWCSVDDRDINIDGDINIDEDTDPIHALTVILPKDMVDVDEEDEFL